MDRITIDSNVWRDNLFITWLQSENSPHKAHICPIIIYLETRLWYDMRGLQKVDFFEDLENLKTSTILFNEKHVEKLIEITKESRLPFKHHARDFIIGTQALVQQTKLITYNIRHFEWMEKNEVLTPERLVLLFCETKK